MGLTEQIPGWALTRRDRLVTLVGSDSPRGDDEGFGDGGPRRVWVVFGVGSLGARGQGGYAGIGWRRAVPCSGRATARRQPTSVRPSSNRTCPRGRQLGPLGF